MKTAKKQPARDHHEVGECAPAVKWKGKAIRSGEEIAALPRREFLEVESGELRVALLFEIKRRREAEAGRLEYRRLILLVERQRVVLWKRPAKKERVK